MEQGKKPRFFNRLLQRIRTHFIAGILVTVPLALTILILVWLFTSIDNVLQPVIKTVFGRTITGVGFGVTVVIIYVAGLIASNFIGKSLLNYIERFTISQIPLVRMLYRGIKQIIDSFSPSEKTKFLRVVIVEFPSKGTKSIGFVTNEGINECGDTIYYVFIPMAPNPLGGFLLIVKEEEVIPTDISVEDALKMVVSAGKFTARDTVFPYQGQHKPDR